MQRFEFTRTYRELNPGGMAHALAQLWINPIALPGLLLFDGLRGENEVTHAVRLLALRPFCRARRAGCGARRPPHGPERPLRPGRRRARRQIRSWTPSAPSPTWRQPKPATSLRSAEEQALLELVRSGAVTAEALRSSLAIVVEERRNYDPAATQAALLDLAPDRTRVIDTVRYAPVEVAAAIVELQSRVL